MLCLAGRVSFGCIGLNLLYMYNAVNFPLARAPSMLRAPVYEVETDPTFKRIVGRVDPHATCQWSGLSADEYILQYAT